MDYLFLNAINVGPFKAAIRFLMLSSKAMETALYKLAEVLLNMLLYPANTLMCHVVSSQNKRGSYSKSLEEAEQLHAEPLEDTSGLLPDAVAFVAFGCAKTKGSVGCVADYFSFSLIPEPQ